MLIESMNLLSKRSVSASTRTPFRLSSRRRTKSRSRSSSGSGTASPLRLQAIRHHATVVIADIRRLAGAVEIRVELLWIAELFGEVPQHAEDTDHQRVPGLFRGADQQLERGLRRDRGLGIVARLPGRIELAQPIVALVNHLREAVRAGVPGDEMDDPARLKLVQKVAHD